MGYVEQCYQDTLKMIERYRSQGMDTEVAMYEKQAAMWKQKLNNAS